MSDQQTSLGDDPQELNGVSNQPDLGIQTLTPESAFDLRGEQFTWLLITEDRFEFQSLNHSIAAGLADMAAHLNSRRGIYGAVLDFVQYSIDPEAEDRVGQILQRIDEIDPLIVFMAAPIDEALYYELSQEDLPILYFGFGSPLNNLTARVGENIFWLVPPPDEQFAFFLSEVWKHWGWLRPSGNVNEVRVSYLSADQSFPVLQTNPGLDAFLDQNNFDVVLRESIPSSLNASVTNFLVDSISGGTTVLYANTFSPGTTVLLNDINTLAVSEFFVAGGGIWSLDSGTEDFLLDSASLEGYLITLPMAWWSDRENPAIELASTVRAENRRAEMFHDAGYLLALGAADLGAEALRAAIDRAGGANFTGEDVLEQMAVIEDYDVLGGLYTLDYTAGKRSPRYLQLWQVRNDGDWVPLGEREEIPDLIEGND